MTVVHVLLSHQLPVVIPLAWKEKLLDSSIHLLLGSIPLPSSFPPPHPSSALYGVWWSFLLSSHFYHWIVVVCCDVASVLAMCSMLMCRLGGGWAAVMADDSV